MNYPEIQILILKLRYPIIIVIVAVIVMLPIAYYLYKIDYYLQAKVEYIISK